MIDSNNKDKAIIIEQIAAKRAELASLNEKQITLQDNMRLIEQERALKQKLNDKGYLSTIQLLQTKKQFNDLKGRIQDNDAQITQAENSISEYTTKLSALSANFKEEAYKELMTTQTDLSQIEENIKKLNEQVGRLNIVSPSDGIVKVLNIKTIGGVVESAQVLAQIVPLEGQLILETRIDPKDIGYINIGQKANVKISAYDFSRYGTVEGNVEYISATTFSNPDNSKYYTCRISIAKNYIGTDPTKNLIIPGMAVQADIVTGSKSLLAYLLKPINNSLTTAFSEK
jgi:HlyD family secretion protein/adhesin transport system membrane fusion protein